MSAFVKAEQMDSGEGIAEETRIVSGTEVPRLADIMYKCATLVDDREALAGELKVSRSEVTRIRQDMLFHGTGPHGFLVSMLTIFVARNGTFGELLRALRERQLNAAADEIALEFFNNLR